MESTPENGLAVSELEEVLSRVFGPDCKLEGAAERISIDIIEGKRSLDDLETAVNAMRAAEKKLGNTTPEFNIEMRLLKMFTSGLNYGRRTAL